MKKLFSIAAIVAVGLFALIQVLPMGRDHTNPPVQQNAPWPDAHSQEIARRACYDCHSNETKWPWYSNIAPISWQVQNNVIEGREKLNFSQWGIGEQEIDEAAETVQEGEMPDRQYLLLHPEARLTAAEKESLIRGLQALGSESGEGDEEEDDDD